MVLQFDDFEELLLLLLLLLLELAVPMAALNLTMQVDGTQRKLLSLQLRPNSSLVMVISSVYTDWLVV